MGVTHSVGVNALLAKLDRYLARSQWDQAKKAAEELLLLPAGALTERQLAKVYWGCGRACTWLQEYYAAIPHLQMAIRYGLQVRDWDTLGAARAQLGVVYVVTRQLDLANEMFANYYLDLPRYQEAKAYEGLVRYNNALALRRQGRHGEAAVAYRMALDRFIEKGRTRDAADCHQNLAWLYLLERKADEAFPHMECAQSFVEALPDDYRVQMKVCWALLHYVRLEVGDAMELVCDVLYASQPGVTAHHQSEAAWIGGCIALDLGQLDVAALLARKAQGLALEAKEPELMDKAYDLVARVMAADEGMGRTEAAT